MFIILTILIAFFFRGQNIKGLAKNQVESWPSYRGSHLSAPDWVVNETYIRMEKAACVKFDCKVQRFSRFTILHGSSAIGILGMTFHIHNAMEIRIRYFDGNRDAISQTIDYNIWARKVTWWWFRSWYGY